MPLSVTFNDLELSLLDSMIEEEIAYWRMRVSLNEDPLSQRHLSRVTELESKLWRVRVATKGEGNAAS